MVFNAHVIGPAVVLGTVAAGLYGLLAVSLVLTYRVSRTIGFVQGGIALFGMFIYWSLTTPGEEIGTHARMGRIPATLVVVIVGAVLGATYGSTVMGRLADWPRVRLTTYSLGWLLALGTAIIAFSATAIRECRGCPYRASSERGPTPSSGR